MQTEGGVPLRTSPAVPAGSRRSTWETGLGVPGVRSIHYVVVREGHVHPLCNSWIESTDWTVVAAAASCPRCLSRLDGRALASMSRRRGA
jgi:hypothetical protein